jgi:hypothetical protein
MNASDEAWLVGIIEASIGDDLYLDRDEEKKIREDAARRGIAYNDVERILRRELDKPRKQGKSSVSEQVLTDELDLLLHQFTDNDKYLDAKEERDALDKVLIPASGKLKGLDPQVANEYVDNFCKSRGVRRAGSRKWLIPVAAVAALVLLGVIAVYFLLPREVVVPGGGGDKGAYSLTSEEQKDIDDQLRRATQYVEQAQYTDPPERSAKACLDRIKSLDPKGQHRGAEVTALVDKIVEQYIALAQKSHNAKNMEDVKKWLERARLFNKNSEIIRDKERAFGIVQKEQ